MAAEKQVILCALPPHTTHLTQPLDICCFAPLKVAWRDICHKFRTSNPGRSVSRYDFCGLFAKAWFKAFSMQNIISSFESAGICPFNRRSIRLPDDDSFSTFKPNSLVERTGLAYIPLYSPARPSRPSIVDASSEDEPQLSARIPYQKYSTPVKRSSISSPLLFSTTRSYSEPSLLDASLFSCRSQPLPFTTPMSKFLYQPIPPSKIPTKKGKSAGRVLTSRENLQQIQEREEKKQAAAVEKERKKRMREEKAKEKKDKGNSKKGKPRTCTYSEPLTEQTWDQEPNNESGSDCSQLPESPVRVPTVKAKRSLVRDSKSSKKLQVANPRTVCTHSQQKKAPSKETGDEEVRLRRVRILEEDSTSPLLDSEPLTEQTWDQEPNCYNESGSDCSQLPESPVRVPTVKAKRSLVRDSNSSKKLQVPNPWTVCTRSQQKKAPSKKTGGDCSQLPESLVVVTREKTKKSLVRDSKKLQLANPLTVCTRSQQKKPPSKETGGDYSQLRESPVRVPTEKTKRSLVRDSKSSNKLQVENPRTVCTRSQQKKAPSKETGDEEVRLRRVRFLEEDSTSPLLDSEPLTEQTWDQEPNNESGSDCSQLPESPVRVPTVKAKRSLVRDSKSSKKLQVANSRTVCTRSQQKKAPSKETGDSSLQLPKSPVVVPTEKIKRSLVRDSKSSKKLQVTNPRSMCTSDQQKKAPSKETGGDSSLQLPESPLPTENVKRSLVLDSKKQRALCKKAGSDNSCVEISDSDPDPEWWIEALVLFEDDKEILLSDTECLNGNIINASQTLMSLQFPHISGFQDTGLALTLNFQPVDRNAASVQILHTGDTKHWICTFSMKGSSAVMIVDSLALFMGLSLSTILQITKIYKVPHKESTIEVHKLSVQQQKGVLDCGLFSVAYAMEICLGRNPQCAHFDQDKMRNHLYECLCEGTMTAFPKLPHNESEALPCPSPVVKHIKVYCICRMPEKYDDMVCCDGCDKWFHITCMNLRNKNLPKQWKCHECS